VAPPDRATALSLTRPPLGHRAETRADGTGVTLADQEERLSPLTLVALALLVVVTRVIQLAATAGSDAGCSAPARRSACRRRWSTRSC